MKQMPHLKISINTPCNQQWENMPQHGDGRSCAMCSKTIVDFSGMSDTELLLYFKTNPKTHCGRFHNYQLNRNIEPPVQKKHLLSRLNKIAAAVFTFLSLRPFEITAQKTSTTTVQNVHENKAALQKATTKAVISGKVLDDENKPLKGVAIILDTTTVATTDENGNYSFEINDVIVTTHHLYFSYDGLVTQVRNYHPAMASTKYDIQLEKPSQGRYIMGGIKLYEIDFPSLSFKKAITKLNADQKATLSIIAQKLKENPEINIVITGYPEVHGARRFDNHHRLENITRFLIDKNGISRERVSTSLEINGGNTNIIDIKQEID